MVFAVLSRLILPVAAIAVFAAPPAAAQLSPQGAAQASALVEASDSRDWVRAVTAAQALRDPAAVELVNWERLRAGDANWWEYVQFLRQNGNWPGLSRLRSVGEARIPANAAAADVLAFFGDETPQTGAGVVALDRALRASGRAAQADALVVEAWRTMSLDTLGEQQLAASHPALIAPHHIARTDLAIWDGRLGEAERMIPRLPADWRALAAARIALRRNEDGVNGLIDAVPASLRSNPGLAYDRFRWRDRRDLDTAIDLMRERSGSAAMLGQPEAWARARTDAARRAMRTGNISVAYELASRHGLTEGSQYAELEWLAGYLQLRRLRNPQAAIRHFERFSAAVASPISVGRAGYWLGRAHEAAGNAAAAQAAYRLGAEHQVSFYGQLAAQKIGAAPDPTLSDGNPVDWRRTAIANDPRLAAAGILYAGGDWVNGELFLTRLLLDQTDLRIMAAISQYALEVAGRADSAVRLSKEAAQKAITLPLTAYPLMNLPALPANLPPEMVMALSRQESELNPEAESHVGARGLMQLMPGTARDVSRQLGIAYSLEGLKTDPAYNIRLGTTYLSEQLDTFGGSYIMAAAAYNAGPGRPRQWAERYGDPRRMDVEGVVDWIEGIPFNETRNYVMRVLEGMHVYRQRLAGRPVPLRIEQDITAGR